jgi:hypothetical protein
VNGEASIAKTFYPWPDALRVAGEAMDNQNSDFPALNSDIEGIVRGCHAQMVSQDGALRTNWP